MLQCCMLHECELNLDLMVYYFTNWLLLTSVAMYKEVINSISTPSQKALHLAKQTTRYLTKICEIIICFVVVGELEAEFVALTRAERPLPYYRFGVQVINLRLQYLN